MEQDGSGGWARNLSLRVAGRRPVSSVVGRHEKSTVIPEPVNNETEYEFEPFEIIFLRRREQILKLVGVAGHALRAMKGSARLSEVLHHPPEAVDRVRELESLALEQVKADLPLLHSASAVLIWGALEAAFRDFLVRWLVRYPAARLVPELNNVRVRVAEYERLQGEDRMRYLVNILERELAASLRPGVGRFDCLLKPFGIRPKVSESAGRGLNELAAVRNVIVHRAGIADSRLLELCPSLGLRIGETVTVGRAAFENYVAVTSGYAAALIESAREVSRVAGADNHVAQQGAPADPLEASR